VLASLLPGLRQVRTPLAVGYIWLLILWYIFGDYALSEASRNLFSGIFELSALLGKGAVLAAITFTAYLIGTITKLYSPTVLLRTILSLRLQFSRGQIPALPESVWRAIWDLRERQGLTKTASKDEIKSVLEEALLQRHDLRTKLLISDKELFGEYDRLEAEAEFRANVTFPLGILLIIFTYSVSPIWLFGFIPLGILGWQGTTREFEALAVLIRAILVGKISASKAPEVKAVT
jgi:hypothetical protein